ncbi:MAG: hypothetical protein KDC19_14200 [Saprospiraceae bacterium]|nr:hypothetical protein [Saprospiraceae bacterium]
MVLIGYILTILAGILPLNGQSAMTQGMDSHAWTIQTCTMPDQANPEGLWQAPGPMLADHYFPLLLVEPELETDGNPDQSTGKPAGNNYLNGPLPLHRLPDPVHHQPHFHSGSPSVPRYILHEAYLI